MAMKEEDEGKEMGQVIKIDEARIRDHLGEMVRGTVEETLNALLDSEADELCGAGRYQRSADRVDTRAGSYDRTLQTKAGEVKLKVPKLRQQVFETAIIERYRRREASVEEALIEMYLAGISVRRVEDITEALWGTRVSPATVSNLNKKIYAKIEAWRNRPIAGEHPYLYLDGIVMKRSWAGEVRNVSLLVVYAQLYRAPRLTLLYPHHPGLGSEDIIHARHRIAGNDIILETASIDVANGKNLLDRFRRLLLVDESIIKHKI
jgi:putative transposase